MLRSNRGAARVSIVWIIAAGVLFLVAIVFAFVASSDLATERQRREQALAERQRAEALADQAAQYARELSVAVGWYDPESADPRTDVEAMRQAVGDLRQIFPDLADGDDTFAEIRPKIVAAWNAKNQRIAELEGRIQSLESELQSAQGSTQQVAQEKDQQLAQLRQQLADELQAAEGRMQELEQRVNAVNEQLSSRDLEARSLAQELADARRGFDREKQTWQARVNALAETAKFSRDPFYDYPDGEVLEVSSSLPLAFIDIGSKNRLVRGVRFRVEGGTPGNRRQKGWVEVTRVQPSMAEVSIVELADPFDPIVAGDVVINRLYDPTGERNAILVGRFSGEFNERELTSLLSRMGVNVQDRVDETTHFMIVGSEVYSDQETGEPLEEPIPPSDLPEYKDALELGVQVIPLQDVRQFFQVETSPQASAQSS